MARSLVPRSCTRLISRIPLVVVFIAACGEPGTAPPSAPPTVTVRGTVQDSANHPVGGALTRLTLWMTDSLVPSRS
ncbi:MAG: hypothetical protein ABI742_15250, partial [Gemmatimonadota bacterium]